MGVHPNHHHHRVVSDPIETNRVWGASRNRGYHVEVSDPIETNRVWGFDYDYDSAEVFQTLSKPIGYGGGDSATVSD